MIGGSMAGLLTARVLADQFERVTVIERDAFPDEPDHRTGVPQSRHAHALLGRGHAIIHELFPGIADELVERGALVGDGRTSIVIVSPAGRLPSSPGGRFVGVSRVLLEWAVRRRLAAIAGVTLVAGRVVVGLEASADRGRVTA